MPRRRVYDRTRTCVKCKINRGNIVIQHSIYCRSCFVPLISNKFSHALDRSLDLSSYTATIEQGSNVFIGFSGGTGSAVLLDLALRNCISPSDASASGQQHHGLKNPLTKRQLVWKKTYVGFVDISGAFPHTSDRTDEIRSIMSRYPQYELVELRIENAFDALWWRSLGKSLSSTPMTSVGIGLADMRLALGNDTPNASPLERLRAFLHTLPTPSAVSTTISHIIRLLLLYAAEARSCLHLLLGNTLTSLSISLISSISSGGGFIIQDEREEVWKSIKIIKPLRDVTNKECAAWLHWAELQVLQGGISSYEVPGVTRLTRDFIVGLDKNFPSTVSTIFRTCAKLTPKGSTGDRCAFCQRPVQYGVQEWKARISIRSRREPVAPAEPVVLRLCYSCHTAFTSKDSKGSGSEIQAITTTFPVWVGTDEWAGTAGKTIG